MTTETPQRVILRDVSVVDIVTALSAISAVTAASYNLGFFSAVDGGLISTLTIQDMLLGTAIALTPASLALFVGYVAPKLWPRKGVNAQSPDGIWLVITKPFTNSDIRVFPLWVRRFLFGIAIFLSLTAYVWTNAARTFLPELQPYIFILSGLLWLYLVAISNGSRALAVITILIFSFASAYSFGRSSYFSIIGNDFGSQATIQTESDSSIYGRVVRVTTEYVFMYSEEKLVVLPKNDIRRINMDAGLVDPIVKSLQDQLRDTTPDFLEDDDTETGIENG